MADYKDILAGTFKSVASKVKSVANDVANSDTIQGIKEHGADRAKAYATIARLTLNLNGDTEELNKVYTEIGRVFYEQEKDNNIEGVFSSLFAQVDEISQRISAAQETIASMKAEFDAQNVRDDDGDDADFEQVVNDTAKDGSGEGQN